MGRKFLIAIIVILALGYVIRKLIFSTTLSEKEARAPAMPKEETQSNDPVTLNLQIPKKEKPVSPIAVTNESLTLFLLKEEKVYAYKGRNIKSGKLWDLSLIGDLLSKEKQTVGDSLVVFIKPSRFATYTNTVDLLDKLSVNKIENYTLLDVTTEEEAFIEKKQKEESK